MHEESLGIEVKKIAIVLKIVRGLEYRSFDIKSEYLLN